MFRAFAVTHRGERLTVNHAIGLAPSRLGALFVFKGLIPVARG